ncbi:MAG: hypothetical protein ACE37F_17840 [Nannocystaceae bacterium]|nr:hypothetical protein [bacterium]
MSQGTNEAPHAALRAFERDRWVRQADVLRTWLAALPPCAPAADALRRALAGQVVPNAALAQMRFDLARDATRLARAIEGNTPSAVPQAAAPQSTEAFARDEAVHTLDNALTFLRRVPADAPAMVERAQRWIQRLRWELVDTGVHAEVPVDFSAAVVADPERVCAIAAETIAALTQLRDALCR